MTKLWQKISMWNYQPWKTCESDKVCDSAKLWTKKFLAANESSNSESESMDNGEGKDHVRTIGKDLLHTLFKNKHEGKAVSGEARASKDVLSTMYPGHTSMHKPNCSTIRTRNLGLLS